MTADIIQELTPEQVAAWLSTEEGEEWWSRNRPRSPVVPGPPPSDQTIGDLSEDPTGRPPTEGPALIAATGGEAA